MLFVLHHYQRSTLVMQYGEQHSGNINSIKNSSNNGSKNKTSHNCINEEVDWTHWTTWTQQQQYASGKTQLHQKNLFFHFWSTFEAECPENRKEKTVCLQTRKQDINNNNNNNNSIEQNLSRVQIWEGLNIAMQVLLQTKKERGDRWSRK